MKLSFEDKIIKNSTSSESSIIKRNFLIDKDKSTRVTILYSDLTVNKNQINLDILNPLMHHFDSNFKANTDPYEFLLMTVLPMANAYIETSFSTLVSELKCGKTLLFIEENEKAIVFDTTNFTYRTIQSPTITSSIAAAKEDISESLDQSMSMLKRHIKDQSLVIDSLTIGRRSKTKLNICYLKDIANETVVSTITEKLHSIDIDNVQSIGGVQQLIENYSTSFFPQSFITDSFESIVCKIYEGKVALFMEGSPYALSAPAIFVEFFQNLDDYNQRTLVASFARLLRFFTLIVVLTLPSFYIILTKFNPEFLLDKYIRAIVSARAGIPLTPFLEMFVMEFIVELLREGGIRLPSKVGQTLSIVSGIIIGDAAIQSNIISPPALFVIGISVVCTFLIPNYQMALSIRLIKFPLLILSNIFGAFGFFFGIYLMIFMLFNLDSYGIDYLEFFKPDMKDTFIRDKIPNLKRRPKILKLKDKYRERGTKND